MSKRDTKAERRAAAREARLQAQRQRQKARRRRQIVTWGVIGVVVFSIAGFVVVRQFRGDAAVEDAARAAGCTAVKKFEEQAREHIEPGAVHDPYNSTPPTSGPHLGNTAEWGTYSDRVEDELLVHNLEHGGVIVHYKDLSDNEIEDLEDLVESHSEGVILNPNPDIEKPIALASWQRLRTCDRPSEVVVEGFVDEFCGKGPEKVPLGC